MNLENKIDSILVEYSFRKDNKYIGSGFGGNVPYLSELKAESPRL